MLYFVGTECAWYRAGFIAFAISTHFSYVQASILRSFSCQSNVMRNSGRPLASL
jgi:hypothetical protein